MGALLLLLGLRLLLHYQTYSDFIAKPFYYTYVNVINAYEKTKGNKTYTVLKLKSDEGLSFYTTHYQKKDFSNKRLRIQIFPSAQIGFFEYLGTFYVRSKIKKIVLLPATLKDTLIVGIENQHESSQISSFYAAIFFATPIDKSLREQIAKLGVSHLVALSGFHLGILWGLVYGLLGLLYKPLQQRYFPYRYALIDVGIVAMSLLGLYVYFVDFPPSLLRSFAMVFVGWVVLLLGMELLSFTFLLSVILLLLALFPYLLVSLGFWLSVAGVYYIFLLLSYTQKWNKWYITLLVIPLGIFLLMLPVVHVIFGLTSGYQLLSPLLSILFVPFYPFVMLTHLLGMGDVLDSLLLGLFNLAGQSEQKLLAPWLMLAYVFLSLLAIVRKKAFYLLLGLAGVYALILFGL